jgi:hypothetical protein
MQGRPQNSRTRGRFVLLAIVLLLGSVLGWMAGGRDSTTDEPSELQTPARAEGLAGPHAGSLPSAELGPSAPGPSVAREDSAQASPAADGHPPRVVYASSIDYLRDFWGDTWPELRAELEERFPERLARYEALVLTEDLVPPPLSELEDEIIRVLLEAFDSRRDYLAWRGDAEPWPEVITEEFVREKLGSGPSGVEKEFVQGVQQVADALRPALTEARHKFFEAARIAVEREAHAGAYTVWPLILVGPGMDPRTGELSTRSSDPGNDVRLTAIHQGLWFFVLHVFSDEYPNVHDLRLEMDALGGKRLREAKAV